MEAYTAVMPDPIVANSRWFADMVGNRMEIAGKRLPGNICLAAEARGRVGGVFDVLGRFAHKIKS